LSTTVAQDSLHVYTITCYQFVYFRYLGKEKEKKEMKIPI